MALGKSRPVRCLRKKFAGLDLSQNPPMLIPLCFLALYEFSTVAAWSVVSVMLWYARVEPCCAWRLEGKRERSEDFSSGVQQAPGLWGAFREAPPAGIEPATYRLGGGCSILLSYGSTCAVYLFPETFGDPVYEDFWEICPREISGRDFKTRSPERRRKAGFIC